MLRSFISGIICFEFSVQCELVRLPILSLVRNYDLISARLPYKYYMYLVTGVELYLVLWKSYLLHRQNTLVSPFFCKQLYVHSTAYNSRCRLWFSSRLNIKLSKWSLPCLFCVVVVRGWGRGWCCVDWVVCSRTPIHRVVQTNLQAGGFFIIYRDNYHKCIMYICMSASIATEGRLYWSLRIYIFYEARPWKIVTFWSITE